MKLGQKIAVNYIRARLNLLAVFSKKKAAEKAFHLFCTPFYRNRKELPPVFKTAESISMNIKGITVRGYKWNQGGTQRVLVVHGFESSAVNFEAYIKALVRKNYEVIAFDAPAHGLSGGKQITLPLYAYMIETIWFRLGGVQSFVAHSFGGLALVHALEQLPHDETTRLVLIAPATETTTAIDSLFRFLQLNEGVRKEFDKIIEQKSGSAASWFSIPRALQQIKADVLWVHDREDDITPFKDAAPVVAANYPNVHFFITQGLGHKKIYRDPAVIEKIMNFL